MDEGERQRKEETAGADEKPSVMPTAAALFQTQQTAEEC